MGRASVVKGECGAGERAVNVRLGPAWPGQRSDLVLIRAGLFSFPLSLQPDRKKPPTSPPTPQPLFFWVEAIHQSTPYILL